VESPAGTILISRKVDVPISRIDAATNRKKRRIAHDEKRREKRMKHQATLQNV